MDLLNIHIVTGLIFLNAFSLTSFETIDWLSSKPGDCIYDDNFTFPYDSDNPLEIYYKLLITDIYDLNEEKMEFGMQIYVFEFWKYNWPELDMNVVSKNTGPQSIPERIRLCLWSPDLIFPNCKQYDLYSISVPNTDMKILPNGYINRFSRFHLVVSCPMDFKNFPMDTQTCGLNITMFATIAEAKMMWIDETKDSLLLKLKPNIELVQGVKPLQFSMREPVGEIHSRLLPTGTTMRYLVCQFTFERHLIASILNTYIPSFLVVCLSFVSFWLDANAIPGRVTLGVTALLTLTTQIIHSRNVLPQVDYITAIDFWLFGCLVLVFFSLIEFTVTQSIARNQSNHSTVTQKKERSIPAWNKSLPIRNTITKIKSNKSIPITKSKIRVLKSDGDNLLDQVSRIVFPLVLIAFTILYWVVYFQSALKVY